MIKRICQSKIIVRGIDGNLTTKVTKNFILNYIIYNKYFRFELICRLELTENLEQEISQLEMTKAEFLSKLAVYEALELVALLLGFNLRSKQII